MTFKSQKQRRNTCYILAIVFMYVFLLLEVKPAHNNDTTDSTERYALDRKPQS